MSQSCWQATLKATIRLALAVGLLVAMVMPAAAQGPGLRLLAPANGAAVDGANVPVRFEVTNITIVPSTVPLEQAGQHPEANRPGEGHLHLMLDLDPLIVWEHNEPYVFKNLPPGDHSLMVELVNNDHSSLSPPVVQQIRFRTVAPQTMPASGMPGAGGERLQSMLLVGALVSVGLGLGLTLRRRGHLLGRGAR